MNLSFSGCGFMGIYHVGVASAIKEYAPHLVAGKITGASAGALAACGLICNICLGQATSDVLKIVIQARAGALGPLRPSFNLVRILRQGLFKNLPPDAHKICNGRLHISLTRFSDGKNVLVNKFDTKDDLVQALICSMFIPFYCGALPPTYKGERYIDGGWSDNLPSLDENTVTVSPFSGESDICPQDSESSSFLSFDLRNTNVRFTARNVYRIVTALFPPHPEIMSEMCRQGFEDALRFLASRDLLSCTRCVAVRSSIHLTSDRGHRVSSSDDALFSLTDEDEYSGGQQQAADEITPSTTPATPSSAVFGGGGGGGKIKGGSRSTGAIMTPRGATRTPAAARARVSTAGRRGVQQQAGAGPNVSKSPPSNSSNVPYSTSEGALLQPGGQEDILECESCRNAARIAAGKGLPKVVRDTLADAEAGERTLLTRLLSLTPIKWLRYLTIPWLLPLDVTYALCKKFLDWLPSLSEDAHWLFDRATEAVRFVMSEIEAQKKLTSRFSCQFSITELNYTSVMYGGGSGSSIPGTPVSGQSLTSTIVEPVVPSGGRRASVTTAPGGGGGDTGTPGQWTVSEGNLGFTVDLNSRSHRVREMTAIVHKDKPERSKYPAARVAHVADGLGWEGLQKAASAASASGSTENVHQHEDFDAFASILAFTRRQEALMAYYYLDENNRMKVTEIYGTTNSRSVSRRQSVAAGGGSNKEPATSRNQAGATTEDSGVLSGVSAPELEAALLAKVPGASISYNQGQGQGHHSQHHHQAGGGGGVQRSASFPKHRRAAAGGSGGAGGPLSGRCKTITFVSPISTASESEETEKLFVPDRRRRRADSETEAAAYEPEDSSGDD